MVEFALIFMLLFTVITLIAEGGFLFGAWLAATNGAREGARYGAPCLNRTVNPCYATPADGTPNVYNSVYQYVSGFPGDFAPPIVMVSGGTVTVTVTATVSSVAPILGNITVYGQSTMRLENQ